MKAIILAAFRGKRMSPISMFTPKALLPIIPTRETVIDHLMGQLYRSGAREFGVVVGEETREPMEEHLRKFKDRYEIVFFESYEHGTASGLYDARSFITDDNPFFVACGDIYSTDYLKGLSDLGPLVVSGYLVKNASKFGTLEVENSRLVRIREKEGIPQPALINASLYLFNRKVFPFIERTEINPKRRERELTDTINLMIEEGNPFHVYNLRGRWRDIGYPRDWLFANLYALLDLFSYSRLKY